MIVVVMIVVAVKYLNYKSIYIRKNMTIIEIYINAKNGPLPSLIISRRRVLYTIEFWISFRF